MTTRRTLASSAIRAALRVRQRANIPLDCPVCPYDLCEGLGIEVRFVDIPSLEGLYVKRDPPLILIAADRPPGRQAFTCAHELGHHTFNHGTRADFVCVNEPRRSPDTEYLADIFAAFLLMPKSTVLTGFRCRGWEPHEATEPEVYIVATWLGVSYEAFATHLARSLGLIKRTRLEQLLRVRPQQLRRRLLGRDLPGALTVVDDCWKQRAVDVRVGDHVLVPVGSVCTNGLLDLSADHPSGLVFRAIRPGIGSLTLPSGVVAVRVRRLRYAGRAVFRHLEDSEDG